MQKESRTKNSLRNTFWGILYKIIAIILPFLTRTIIIRLLGIEYAGISSLFTSILSVLSLTELGFSTAILYSMYKTVAENNTEKTNAFLNYYKKVYRIVAIVILLIGSLVCARIDLFIVGDVPSDLNIYVVYLLFLLSTVSSYSFFAYTTVLFSANQRDDIAFRINIGISIFREIAQLVLLVIFRNYYLFVLIALCANIIHNLISYFITRKIFPEFKAKGNISLEEKNKLKKNVSGLMIGKLSVVSRNSFDSIVISAFLGLAATAIYNNYYYIMYSVFGLIYYFCSGMRTSIGNKIAIDTKENNYKDMINFSFGFYVIYAICSSMMLCLFQPFMAIWVGQENTAGLMLAILMVIYFFLYCSTAVVSQYWEGAGLFWENKTRFIVEAAANLVLDVVFAVLFGINGIILATIVTMLFSTNIFGVYIVFKHYFKGCDIKKYFFNHLLYTLVCAISCFVSFIICEFISISGFLGLLYRAYISFVIPLIFIILLFFKKAEFKAMFLMLKNIVIKHFKIKFGIFVASLTSFLAFFGIALLVVYFLII